MVKKRFVFPVGVTTLIIFLVFGCAKKKKEVPRLRPEGGTSEIEERKTPRRKAEAAVKEIALSELWQISTGRGYHSFPTWSPDGKKIAYTAYQEGRQDIWVVEVDENGQPKGTPLNITNSASMDEHPSWDRYGERIVFHSDREEGKRKLFIIDADGSNLKLLYQHWTEKGLKESFNPSWSPDGERIAFVAENNIWVIDKEGRREPRLITSSGYNDYPSWSPDGSWLAFYSGNSIKLIKADGSEERELTGSGGMGSDFPGWSGYPSWSPDGEKIAFISNRKKMLGGEEVKYYDLWIVKSDGTGAKYLTNDKYREYFPVWSPNGKKIAFQSNRKGDFHIWVISVP